MLRVDRPRAQKFTGRRSPVAALCGRCRDGAGVLARRTSMPFPWNRMERDLKNEIAHHLHELTAEYERRGHSHADAVRMAKREFGGSEQVKERCRDERRWAWMSGIRQDLVFALRQMRRSPGFAATAVLTLALGIAANVIVFGVLQTLVLRSINVPRGDRVMMLELSTSAFPLIA